MLTYTIRGQLVTIGRSYHVENEAGERLFKIAGRLGFARVFSVKGRDGARLYSAREKLLSIDRTFIIKRDGLEEAVVKRTSTSDTAVDHYEVALKSGETLHAKGKLWTEDGMKITRAAKPLGSIRRDQHTFAREKFIAEVEAAADQGLLLAIIMSIVEMTWRRGELRSD